MSSRKPPSNPDDWDDFEVPRWDDSVANTPRRDTPSTPKRPPSRGSNPDPYGDNYESATYPPRSSTTPRQSQPPRLSSRVPTRTTRPAQQDPYRPPEDRYGTDPYAADPYNPHDPTYDTAPQRGSAASQYELYADPALEPGWEGASGYDSAPPPRRRPRQHGTSARPSVNISRPAITDGVLTTIVGVAVLGFLVMVGTVWYGIGNVSATIPWHLNASGDADRWASDSSLWRIPFGVFMALVIGIILGAFLWKRDRFAARFIVASMCVVQVLAWVAVIDHLW